MANMVAMRNLGGALLLLVKPRHVSAAPAAATVPPNLSRLYFSSLRVRGGAFHEESALGEGAAMSSVACSHNTRNPFSHLPNIEPSLLTVERTRSPGEKTEKSNLVFGKTFTDHMLCVDWNLEGGWRTPKIIPYGDVRISPAASSLHYALQCFEGMKAYKDARGKVRLFRPDLNVRRFNKSLARLRFPTVDENAMVELLSKLVMEDADWIPEGDGYSLYIRPTAISTHPYLGVSPAEAIKLYVILSPVGPYFKGGFKPVRLYADTVNTRAWPGGMGFAKAGGNYAPTILPAVEAQEQHKCEQVLWLFGKEHYVTEVGAMNIFFLMEKESRDGVELVTSPLDQGDILDGVTRRSVLELAREFRAAEEGGADMEVTERPVTMGEIVKASEEGRLQEVFGTGTAAVICPVGAIKYQGRDIEVPTGEEIGPLAKRLWKTLTDIQYGRLEHPWSFQIS